MSLSSKSEPFLFLFFYSYSVLVLKIKMMILLFLRTVATDTAFVVLDLTVPAYLISPIIRQYVTMLHTQSEN